MELRRVPPKETLYDMHGINTFWSGKCTKRFPLIEFMSAFYSSNLAVYVFCP